MSIAESNGAHQPHRPRRKQFFPVGADFSDRSTALVPSVNSALTREEVHTSPLTSGAEQQTQPVPSYTPPTNTPADAALLETAHDALSPVSPLRREPDSQPHMNGFALADPGELELWQSEPDTLHLAVAPPGGSASPPAHFDEARVASRPLVWIPGTFGFDGDHDLSDFPQQATLRTEVVENLVNREGHSRLKLQSEVSGAAGAAGIVGMGNVVGTVLKYGSNFLIQYGFGPATYGLYTLSLSLINLITSIFNLGLDDAMVRFVAIYRGKKQPSPLQGLVIFCTVLAGLAGLIAAALLLLFTPNLVHFWTLLRPANAARDKDTLEKMIPLLQLMSPLIPLLCMQVIWFAGLRGFKAFKLRVLATSIVQPLLQLVLLLGVLLFFRYTMGIALALLISTIVSVILTLNFLVRQVRIVAIPAREEYRLREWLTFATLNFLTAIIDTVLDSVDTLLLATFGVPRVQLGLYGAAIRLSNFIALPLISLNNVFAPTIAELHSKGEKARLETMFKVVTKWSITFSLPIFLVVVLFSPYLLVLSGVDFQPAWPLVVAFAVGSMLNAGTGSVGYMLLMTGHNKLSFINSVVAVIVNVVLGIILTPRYGAMGTAISTGLAIGVLNLMRLLQVRVLLKMQPYRLDTLKPLGAALMSGAFTGGLLYLFGLMKWHATLGHAIISAELALIPIFVASYIGLLIVFKGSPEDEIVLGALRKKFMRGGKAKAAKTAIHQ
jgi:O-antigen/teichoic acid export membrane protein